MKHGIVGRFTSGYFRYQGWPTVARAEDGTLYAACSGHRLDHVCPFGKNLMYVSHDEGETWSAPMIVNDTHLDDRDAGLVCWGEGNILLTWFNNTMEVFENPRRKELFPNLTEAFSLEMMKKWENLPMSEYGSFSRISRDGGNHWSEQRKSPVTAPHGPIRRADGSFLYVGAERLSGWDLPPATICAAESFDEGETWQLLSILPNPKTVGSKIVEKVCEPHCVNLGNGELLAAVRCVLTEMGEECNQRAFTVYTTRSCDNGKTWEEPVFTDRFGAPPHFLLHSSGALILSCGKRTAPFGQYARISWDKGHTWEEDILISEEAAGSPVDEGYPSSVELPGGDILTVYYQPVPGDDYPSILSTRWQLPEKK